MKKTNETVEWLRQDRQDRCLFDIAAVLYFKIIEHALSEDDHHMMGYYNFTLNIKTNRIKGQFVSRDMDFGNSNDNDDDSIIWIDLVAENLADKERKKYQSLRDVIIQVTTIDKWNQVSEYMTGSRVPYVRFTRKDVNQEAFLARNTYRILYQVWSKVSGQTSLVDMVQEHIRPK
jgi:hypothetical protein